MALLNPGDEVLLFEPFYGYHVATLNSLRMTPVFVPLTEPGFALDLDALKAAITPRTRALVLNTPANPSGKVFTLAELEAIAEVVQEHDLFLITDEIYEYFVYDGTRHIAPSTLPGMKHRTIVISGFSKTFSVTGWRVGYVLADARWLPSIAYFHDLTYVCAPRAFPARVRRRTRATSAQLLLSVSRRPPIQARPHARRPRSRRLQTHRPRRRLLRTSRRQPHPRQNHLQKKRAISWLATGVAAVAGSAFFRPGHGENLLRFCFAKKDHDLDEACARLRKL